MISTCRLPSLSHTCVWLPRTCVCIVTPQALVFVKFGLIPLFSSFFRFYFCLVSDGAWPGAAADAKAPSLAQHPLLWAHHMSSPSRVFGLPHDGVSTNISRHPSQPTQFSKAHCLLPPGSTDREALSVLILLINNVAGVLAFTIYRCNRNRELTKYKPLFRRVHAIVTCIAWAALHEAKPLLLLVCLG